MLARRRHESGTGPTAMDALQTGVLASGARRSGASRAGRVSAACLVFMSGLAAAPALGQADDLPITKITLYRSGVGYFERRGLVEGRADIQLRFATDQINDILKSMVLLDLGGGQVDLISYGSKEPLQRRLASFGLDISDNPSIARIFERLRGAPVSLSTAVSGAIAGSVVGVEHRPTPTKEGGAFSVPFVTILTDSGLRTVAVPDITNFEILDHALAAELSKALAALAEHRADRVKSVDISLSGPGSREIIAAYVHEMPVWKASYRLVLPEAEGDAATTPGNGKPRTPTIQGWAVVENTTDEDWSNVQLSLVAGRPVSFQMDLYEPLHVARPFVPVPTVAGATPRVYAEGDAVDKDAEDRDDAGRTAAAERMRGVQTGRAAPGAPADAALSKSLAQSQGGGGASPFEGDQADRQWAQWMAGAYGAAARADAAEIGEVFQYQLSSPITLERQRSAMLPILSSPIQGRRVSIFNASDGAQHAMRGVELKNSTGLQLMPGPLAVYDGPAYAGDAQIGHVSAGDERLLAYSVDLDLPVRMEDRGASDLQKIRIAGGLLEVTSLERRTAIYTATNKDQKRPRTLLVEHGKLAGWDLVDPAKPAQTAGELYRFEVTIAPGKDATLPVVQQFVQRQTWGVLDYDMNALVAHSRAGRCSQAVIDAVSKAAGLQREISELDRRVRELDAERQAIDADQSRLRQNMGAIDSKSELYGRYLAKLSQQETRLEEIANAREAEVGRATAKRGELSAFISGLNVE